MKIESKIGRNKQIIIIYKRIHSQTTASVCGGGGMGGGKEIRGRTSQKI
jgi:hypothetical protein